MTFANSDKFNSQEWEVEYLKERLCKILNIDEETLIEQLANLDKKELGEILFNVDPTYDVSFPEATDKNEEWNMFLQETIDKDRVVSNEELFLNIWAYDEAPSDATIRVYIKNLREIIGKDKISTVRGVGYKFE